MRILNIEANNLNIPVMPEYKYLGTFIDSKLECTRNVGEIKKSLAITRTKLKPILMRENLRFNIRAFQKYAVPKLLLISYFIKSKDKREIF